RRIFVEIGSYVLAFVGLPGFAPSAIESLNGKNFRFESARVATLDDVACVIRGFVAENGDDRTGHARVDQRTIGGNADNRIRLEVLRGLIVAIENIQFASTKAVDAETHTFFDNGGIRRLGGGDDDYVIDACSAPHAIDDTSQHGAA